ncbi:unnamed protein product [Mytilus coruscus]|uniref:Uncharacterized protein n=1 Tax=Mytilus coruscus TaxID=42192 RepID=A0A6J8D3Y8_MYTCO|nr:unnamed protein product [Mytilus coruscus]
MELPNELKALLVTMKLDGKEPEWKFTASSDQVSVQLTWIKAKEPDTSSRKPEPALEKKNKPSPTRRRNANRFAKWMDTKTAVVPAAAQQQNIEASVDHNSQTEARDTIVGKLLTPTKYREGGKRSRIDFDEGFDVDDPNLLITPPHTSPLNLQSKEAIEATYCQNHQTLRTSNNIIVGLVPKDTHLIWDKAASPVRETHSVKDVEMNALAQALKCKQYVHLIKHIRYGLTSKESIPYDNPFLVLSIVVYLT